jgi:predicted HicB family RNase H-like nuclease
MTIRVELNPETEARLKAEARAQGLPVETVAEQLLKEALTRDVLGLMVG